MAENINEKIKQEGTDPKTIKIVNEIFGEDSIYSDLKTKIISSDINYKVPSISSSTTISNFVSTGGAGSIMTSLISLKNTGVFTLAFTKTIAPKIYSSNITIIQFFAMMKYLFQNSRYNYFADAIVTTYNKEKAGEITIPGKLQAGTQSYFYWLNFLSAVFEEAVNKLKKDMATGQTFEDPFKKYLEKTVPTSPKISEQKKLIKQIYPTSFFAYNAPLVPFIQIEFRTKYTIDYNDPAGWEKITFNPNCHFISMEFEDNKGVKRVNLKLFDKFYTDLENIIMKSIFIINHQSRTDMKMESQAGEGNFQFYIRSDNTYTNMRIKFGYNIQGIPDDEKYSIFKNRVKNAEKPVVYTEWYYFLIMGFKQEPTEGGLNINLNAISSTGNFLSNIKMLKKFSIIKGLPKNIINSFASSLKNAFNNTYGRDENVHPIVIRPINTPKNWDEMSFITNDKESQYPFHLTPIEIPLGDKIKLDKDKKPIPEYKAIKEILDDICSKIPPLYLDDSNKISLTTSDQSTENMRLIYYTYSISEIENPQTKKIQNIIRFYYANPDDGFNKAEGIKVRTYYWRNYGASVVKSLSITTETDFAQMNMPLAVMSEKDGLRLTTTKLVNGDDNTLAEVTANTGVEFYPGSQFGYGGLLRDATKSYNAALENNIFGFAGRTYTPYLSGVSTPNEMAKVISAQFAKNINSSIFKGTLELLGDPFYIFDDTIEPYKYLIKIVVVRPDDKKIVYDESSLDNNKKVSYLSGYYVITNIKHKIDEGGYSTSLEVMRWPSAYEIPSPPSS